MYCVSCGSLTDEKLNYCKRCGERTVKSEAINHFRQSGVTEKHSAKPGNANPTALENLTASIGYVGVAGLGSFVGLIAILVGNNVQTELIAAISALFLATVCVVCFLLSRQISRLSEAQLVSNQKSAPEYIKATDAAGRIEAPREPFTSVTENTTRYLDKTKI